MTNTHHLGLPFIEGSQAQKHVTHNEALRILDAIVQIGVLDADRTAPPSSPAEGDRHIVAPGATGAWAGQAQAIALYEDGGWRFFAPKAGWCAWSAADGVLLVHDGTAWSGVAGGGGGGGTGDSVAKLGVNATATAPNLLTVRSSAALFHAIVAADGGSGDMRLQIAKESAANTASVFFSDAYAGHAEFGLTGDNDFHLKVSADGTTWRDAVTFDRATGRASFPGGGVRELLTANRTYYVRTDGSDGNDGLSNSAGGAFKTVQKAYELICATLDLGGKTVTIQLADGTYADPLEITTGWLGGGSVTIQGNTSAQDNVVIAPPAGKQCCVATGGTVSGILRLRYMKLAPPAGSYAINLNAPCWLQFDRLNFAGTSGGYHIACGHPLAYVQINGNYTISGGANAHILCTNKGQVANFPNAITCTLTGAPAFASAFAYALDLSWINLPGVTWSGSATGVRYLASGNAVIDTQGAGAGYLPGSAGGATSTGGQYL